MSQHLYETTLSDGTPVSISAGWDRPLKWLFLSIEGPVEDKRTDEEGFIYSNLHDVHAPKRDWSYFAARLAEHGVAIPDDMSSGIAEDMANDVGNAVTDWNAGEPMAPGLRDALAPVD